MSSEQPWHGHHYMSSFTDQKSEVREGMGGTWAKWQKQDLCLKLPGSTSVLNHNTFTTFVVADLKFFLFVHWVSEWSRSVVSDSFHPMDCSPPGSSIHGIFQARVLEWVAISFSRGSSRHKDWTQVSHLAGRRFYRLSHQGRLFTMDALKSEGYILSDKAKSLNSKWGSLKNIF